MTHDQAKTLLKRYGFDDSDPLDDWLDEGHEMVEDAHDWPFLEWIETVNMVAGATSRTIGSQTSFKPISVRDATNHRKLKPKEVQWWEREIKDPTATGKPKYYRLTDSFFGTPSIYQFQIDVYPVPDSDISLHVVSQLRSVKPSLLGPVGTTQLQLDPALHYPVVLGAAFTGLMAENEEERAQTALQQFDNAVEQRWQRYSRMDIDGPRQVVDVMGYSC